MTREELQALKVKLVNDRAAHMAAQAARELEVQEFYTRIMDDPVYSARQMARDACRLHDLLFPGFNPETWQRPLPEVEPPRAARLDTRFVQQ